MNRVVVTMLCAGLLVLPAAAREPSNSPTVATPAASPAPPPPAPPPPVPPQAPSAAPEDSFPPFVNGKSTVEDVTAKFGRPTSEGHLFGPDGPYNYTYMLDGGKLILVFLFSKEGVLVRVRAYKKDA